MKFTLALTYILLAALALVLAFVPLYNLLAYEFCAALSLLVSLTAGPVAFCIVRQYTIDKPAPSISRRNLYVRAIFANLTSLIFPLVIILINALRVPNCNFSVGFAFYLLLPVATAVICTTWGATVGLVVRSRVLGICVYFCIWLAVAAFNVWEVWHGVQINSYNQLVGWIPGPIYEQVIEPGLPLVFSRVYGLSWAVAVFALVIHISDTRRQHQQILGASTCNRGVFFAFVISAAGALLLGIYAPYLGFGRITKRVESVLSATTHTDHFEIHHSPTLTQEKTELLARDHEFRLHQIEQKLGVQHLPIIQSYVFQNAEQKRSLTGAGHTQYAKPWHTLMCLNGSAFPHPTLKHELVHVVSSAFGSPPLKVSAQNGLWVNPGLTEGLAVAIDWPVGKVDCHTWSAALRKIGNSLAIQQLFDPVGFWTADHSRSYTQAGSFVRFLLDEYGPVRFQKAFRAGTLHGYYPKDTKSLIADWHAFLDGLQIDESVLVTARARYARESVFHQVCAHEIAQLRKQALSLLRHNKYNEATRRAEEILEHISNDSWALEFLMQVCIEQNRLKDAIAIGKNLCESKIIPRFTKVRIQARLADIYVMQGRIDEARPCYKRVLVFPFNDDAYIRVTLAKLEALDHGQEGKKIFDFLIKQRIDTLSILDLAEAGFKNQDWEIISYLLGRQLYIHECYKRAIPFLEKAAKKGFTHPAFFAENLRLLAVSYYRTRALVKAAAIFSVIAQFPRDPGEYTWACDWLERIHFDVTVYPKISKVSNKT